MTFLLGKAATPITSREDLQRLLAREPKAILCFHASWLRGSTALVEAVVTPLVLLGTAEHVAIGSLVRLAYPPIHPFTTTQQPGTSHCPSTQMSPCIHPFIHPTQPTLHLFPLKPKQDVGLYEDLAFEEEVGLLPCFHFYRGGRRVGGITAEDVAVSKKEKDNNTGSSSSSSHPGLTTLLDQCRAFIRSMDEEEEEEEEEDGGDQYHNKATKPTPRFPLVNAIKPGQPLLLFVAGDRSKVGKSSVCLGLLGSLLRLGFEPRGTYPYVHRKKKKLNQPTTHPPTHPTQRPGLYQTRHPMRSPSAHDQAFLSTNHKPTHPPSFQTWPISNPPSNARPPSS